MNAFVNNVVKDRNLSRSWRIFQSEKILLCCLFLVITPVVSAGQTPQSTHWMDAGAAALRRGNAKEAEDDFRQQLAITPESADATLGIGLAQLRQGKPEEAETSLAKASHLNPSILSAHMFRGIALFQMNALKPAIAEMNEEIKLQPKNAEALTWLGIMELQAGEPKLAGIPLDEAGSLMPGDQNILYYQVRAHMLAAQESFRELFKIDPDSAFVHRAQAEIFSESQQPEKAILEYQAAIKKSPSNVELYEALGNEEQKVSHVAEAETAYQAELKLAPGSAIALFNLGKIQVETGDPQQGVLLLQRAVDAHASPAPTYFYLGYGLSKLGKNEEASGWLERSLSSTPSDFIQQRDYFELIRVYQKLNRKADSERALEELKKLKARAAPPGDDQK
jgi:tetratricopeptide (TPR) repeat protein